MMQIAGVSRTQLDGIAPGGQVNLVFEVTSMPSAKEIVGNLLEAVSDGTYRRQTEPLNVALTDNTGIVMGQATDVKPGAILQIRGVLADSHDITAQRIVILTGHVTIQ